MKNGMYATYKGTTYKCTSLHGGEDIKLLSDVYVPDFEESNGIYRLVVSRSDCERVWKQELHFRYLGRSFRVWNTKNDLLFLQEDSDDFVPEQFGFDLSDVGDYGRKIYGKWVPDTTGEKEWVITEY